MNATQHIAAICACAALLLSPWRAGAEEASRVVDDEAQVVVDTAHPTELRRLRIGVYSLPNSPQEAFLDRTVEALRKVLPEMHLEVQAKSEFDLSLAVVKREVDLYVVTSGFFSYLEGSGGGATWLATRKSPQAEDPARAIGGLVVARADDDRFSVLEDTRTALVAAPSPQSFAAWISVLGELANVTPYPEQFFGKAHFTKSSGKAVVDRVLNGSSDIGILRTCEYEALLAQGVIPPGSLKIVGERQHAGFACKSSTALYPDLVFGARPDLSSDLKRRVAAALFAMPVDPNGYGWTVSNFFRDVRFLVQRFGYRPTVSPTVDDATVSRYKYALLIGTLLLAVAVLYSVTVSAVVKRRTSELVAVIDEKTALEETARVSRERLSQLERAGIVSELSSMIAHELRQPVSSLINYADGLALYLSGQTKDPVIEEATREIARQAERVSSIVERVRVYAKGKPNVHQEIDLCAVTKAAYGVFRLSSELSNVRVAAELTAEAPVYGDPLELELLVVNLLKNARHALKSSRAAGGTIVVRLEDAGESWRLHVQDDGDPISDAQYRELSHPVTSDKLEGLGLGLSICRVIAERHAGRLSFRRVDPQGLQVTLIIPKRKVSEEKEEQHV